MSPKRRVTKIRCAIEMIASWTKGAVRSVSPMLRALCCLGYYALAVKILPLEVAQATFWIVFVLCMGPRTALLRLLRAVLGGLLDSLS